MKVGNRVTVKPGVSPRTDAGSITPQTPSGIDRKHLVGFMGEVKEISPDGRVLVDDQDIHQPEKGQLRGIMTMREWFQPEELEVG